MKAVVLSSGGVDSTTCLSLAIDRYGRENVVTVSVFYGQKHKKELECAEKVAAFYHVPHCELDLSGILRYSKCALLTHSEEKIGQGSYEEQIRRSCTGKVNTYVPFRNGLMLSAVASFAAGLFEEEEVAIYLGAHADDAAGNAYPDCSEEFLQAMNRAVSVGTYHLVHVEAPFAGLKKADVVKTGLSLGTPYELTWSCYEGGERPCGKCGTCLDRQKAFLENGIKDPALP